MVPDKPVTPIDWIGYLTEMFAVVCLVTLGVHNRLKDDPLKKRCSEIT
jgi:hypothetical protein